MVLGNSDSTKNSSWLSVFSTLIFAILLLILSSIGWLDSIRPVVSYILDPIYVTASNVAISIEEYVSTLTNISQFRSEYNQMKIDLAENEISIASYQTLINENIDLKTQLELGNKEYQYVQSEILDKIDTDYLIVNVGIHDGVDDGDTVVLGNMFVGLVIEANEYTSKVRLPISKSSFLEAYVIASADTEDSRNILSRAVVSGSSDGIKIENIGMNSGVKNGDIVVVNDSAVGENLILGSIVGLSEDPAATTRSGYVSPIVDYYDLINVFVRLKNDN